MQEISVNSLQEERFECFSEQPVEWQPARLGQFADGLEHASLTVQAEPEQFHLTKLNSNVSSLVEQIFSHFEDGRVVVVDLPARVDESRGGIRQVVGEWDVDVESRTFAKRGKKGRDSVFNRKNANGDSSSPKYTMMRGFYQK